MATIATLPNGKFKAIVKHNGRIVKTKTFLKKSAARQWAKQLEIDQERVDIFLNPGSKILFKDLSKEYLNAVDGQFKDMGRKIGFGKFMCARIGTKTLAEIDTETIESILLNYAQHREPASVNRLRADCSSVFSYAVKRRYIKVNPCKGIENLKEPKGIVRYLSDEEKGRLLNACRESKYKKLHLLVNFALTSGARKGELVNLRWEDLDIYNRTALIRDTKNGESRVLPLTDSVAKELEQFKKVEGLIFHSEIKPSKPFCIRKCWAKALDTAEIYNFRFHDLRHSCASTLVMAGATLYEVSQVLGHKDLKTTARYAHLSTQHKAALINKVFG